MGYGANIESMQTNKPWESKVAKGRILKGNTTGVRLLLVDATRSYIECLNTGDKTE